MFIVEGNIGVGKSTFLKKIQARWPSLEVIQEPVENWNNNQEGKSLLAQFYQNPHRWAYTLETVTMLNRVKEHLRIQKYKNPDLLIERSIYSGHYCFAKNDFAQGFLNNTEWSAYLQWIQFFIQEQCTPPLGFIYLRATPDICHERIITRAREAEQGIGVEYLEQIHHFYEQFLVHKKEVDPLIAQIPVLILDCNQEFEQNDELLKKHLLKLQAFIETTQNNLPLNNYKKNNEFSLT